VRMTAQTGRQMKETKTRDERLLSRQEVLRPDSGDNADEFRLEKACPREKWKDRNVRGAVRRN